MVTKTDVPVAIKNGVGELPCDLIRLLRAYTGVTTTPESYDLYEGEQMTPRNLNTNGNYQHDGTFIRPSGVRTGTILIDYYAVPTIEYVDEGGQKCTEMAIRMDQLDYCAYEAARIMLRDLAARRLIDPSIYQVFNEEAENHFHVAVGNATMMSIDQLEKVHWMNRNAQFFNAK